MKFIIIGITDSPKPSIAPDVLSIVEQGRVFSGGRRHHDIVAPLLPADARWIDITVPLDAVFRQYRDVGSDVVVFASGDPLFFGFANTVRREMPDVEVVLYPSFNSLQMLAHRLLMPYHDMRIVSLTGRPWPAFDRALIERAEKIGVLTDREHTPAAIARRMLDYGYAYYVMHVGEHLGHPEHERVTTLSLEEAAQRDFGFPNCLVLAAKEPLPPRSYGIPDGEFALLDGREKMITKMPIRLLTLQALDLPRRHVLWDIGFCTGSVSIEARLMFPHLQVVAFEVRPECEAIIHANMRRHGAPGIEVLMGDFRSVCSNPSLSASSNPSRPLCCDTIAAKGTPTQAPDAVFIGGHGGHLKEIIQQVLTVLAPDGVIVMNSVVAPRVTTDSRQLWDQACQELNLQQEPPLHIQLNDHHPITILKCKRK